jgi:transcriptional regulator with XRE-family HTH domain
MDISQAFGEALRKLRKDQGLSQEELAHNCDLDRTFISLLERGGRQPSLTTVFALAKELNTTASRFVAQVEKFLSKDKK